MPLSESGPAVFDIRIMPVGVEETLRVPQYGMSKTTGAAMCAVVVSAARGGGFRHFVCTDLTPSCGRHLIFVLS